MNPRLVLLTSLFCLAAATQAGTYIEGRDATGSQRIPIEGDWARMEYGEDIPPEYLLLNLKTHRALNVDRVRKRVVDLSGAPDRKAAPLPATIVFKKRGDGPAIAGYATQRYVLSAGKRVCGEHFVAAKTLENPDIRRFLVALNVFSRAQEAERDPCRAAEAAADEAYTKLGLPLKIVDRRGKVEHEIRGIRSGTTFPAGLFDVPADYAKATPRELMETLPRNETDVHKQTQAPMDAATVKKLREQHMQEHMKEMQRLPPPAR